MLRKKSNRRVNSTHKDLPIPVLESLENRQMMSGTVYALPVEGQLWTPHPFQFSYAGSTASEWKFQINWGDGTGVQNATSIVHNPEAGNLSGYFQTTLTHTYKESGDYTILTKDYFKGQLWDTNESAIQVADAPLIPTNATITVKPNSLYSGVVGSFVDGFPLNKDSKLSDFSVIDVFGAEDTKTDQIVTKADISIHQVSTGKYQLFLNKPTHLAWGNTYKFGIVVKDVGGQSMVIYCMVNTGAAAAAVSSVENSALHDAVSPFSSNAIVSPLAGILDLPINAD